jgi:hypothetical protein
LAPKGLSVSERISLTAALVSSASSTPVASSPSPPASDTAATILGMLIQLMPDSRMGCSIPRASVKLVFISMLLPSSGFRLLTSLVRLEA